jgi:hypothetical protein
MSGYTMHQRGVVGNHRSYIAFALAMVAVAAAAGAVATEGPAGEYFITRNANEICVPFVRNLNQFRNLHFDECHPRISAKFPEFSRPEWHEVPFELTTARNAVLASAAFRQPLSPYAEEYLRDWLNGTEGLRAENRIKMWQATIDVDNDKVVDTLVRVQYANPASDLPVQERGCVYRGSGLFLSGAADPQSRDNFNRYVRGSDVIHYRGTNRYYVVEWARGYVGAGFDGKNIGATRGVVVYLAEAPTYGPTSVCEINWVPTGHYRPLKR